MLPGVNARQNSANFHHDWALRMNDAMAWLFECAPNGLRLGIFVLIAIIWLIALLTALRLMAINKFNQEASYLEHMVAADTGFVRYPSLIMIAVAAATFYFSWVHSDKVFGLLQNKPSKCGNSRLEATRGPAHSDIRSTPTVQAAPAPAPAPVLALAVEPIEETREVDTTEPSAVAMPESAIVSLPTVALPPIPTMAPEPALAIPPKPSFNCAKASNSVERIICSDSELAQLDVQLSSAYKKGLLQSGDPSTLKADQLRWMREERAACSTVACLTSAYSSRVAGLNALAAR